MTRPQINGILETSLYVTDLQVSMAFYQRAFQFPELFSNQRMCALNAGPRQVLLLFLKGASANDMETSGGTVPGHDGDGHLHLAFAISQETLDDWKQWLGDCQIEIESTVNWPAGGVSLYFRDPDGHLLELATPGLWANYSVSSMSL